MVFHITVPSNILIDMTRMPMGTLGIKFRYSKMLIRRNKLNRLMSYKLNYTNQTILYAFAIYTRGQVSVNKRISVLSNYFDVSIEIYYVRLKYIDSIGQVVQLLILRPASICCTFNSGHVGSRAPNVNKMGCLFISIHPGYG